MAYENFSTGWTETDPNGRLAETATRLTWTGLTLNEDASLNKTGGISFTANWDVAFDFRIDSSSGTSGIPPTVALYDAGEGNAVIIEIGEAASSKLYVSLYTIEFGGFTQDIDTDNTTLNINTVYYARFKRNESVGANGTLYLDIYTSDANRQTETSPALQLQVTITVYGKLDFTIAKLADAYDEDTTTAHTGYLENLDLAYVPAVSGGVPYGYMTTNKGFW